MHRQRQARPRSLYRRRSIRPARSKDFDRKLCAIGRPLAGQNQPGLNLITTQNVVPAHAHSTGEHTHDACPAVALLTTGIDRDCSSPRRFQNRLPFAIRRGKNTAGDVKLYRGGDPQGRLFGGFPVSQDLVPSQPGRGRDPPVHMASFGGGSCIDRNARPGYIPSLV